jgi:hypothetical protein
LAVTDLSLDSITKTLDIDRREAKALNQRGGNEMRFRLLPSTVYGNRREYKAFHFEKRMPIKSTIKYGNLVGAAQRVIAHVILNMAVSFAIEIYIPLVKLY